MDMKNIGPNAKPYRDLLRAVKKALEEKDITTALKILTVTEAMITAAIDFDTTQGAETFYDAKAALMEAADSSAKQ